MPIEFRDSGAYDPDAHHPAHLLFDLSGAEEQVNHYMNMGFDLGAVVMFMYCFSPKKVACFEELVSKAGFADSTADYIEREIIAFRHPHAIDGMYSVCAFNLDGFFLVSINDEHYPYDNPDGLIRIACPVTCSDKVFMNFCEEAVKEYFTDAKDGD